uniref:LIM homeobox 9 n=1 Tax=Meleagris gallopavo TaxID=9103 RepID=A0A803Y9Q1_MELGA
MLFHGISGGHIQGIMEEMERRSKTESRLAKGGQMNGRETVRKQPALLEGDLCESGPARGSPASGKGEAACPRPALPLSRLYSPAAVAVAQGAACVGLR